MSGLTELKKIFSAVSSNFEIIKYDYATEENYSVELRVKLQPNEEGFGQACTEWAKKFSEATKTQWIVKQTKPALTKFEFRKDYVCQHAAKNKTRSQQSENPRVRNKECPASMIMVVKKNSRNTRRVDLLMRLGLNTKIKIVFQHTHRIHIAEAYSYLRVCDDVREEFMEYFMNGMTPKEGKTYHELNLIASNNNNSDLMTLLVDAQRNPTDRQVYQLYDFWRKTKSRMTAERVAFPDDAECKDLGTETEAEKQIKKMLEKQLTTKVTLKQQFEQHRSFAKSGNYVPINEIVSGTQSLQEFKNIEQDEFRIQELMKCGLTEEEIDIYLSHNGAQLQKKRKFTLNPDVLSEKLDIIMQKIQERHTSLNQEINCTGLKQLTRHEMEIEKTLYAGCQSKEQLKTLLTTNENSLSALDGPYKHIGELAKRIDAYMKRKERNKIKGHLNESRKPEAIITAGVTEDNSTCTDNRSSPIDTSLFHAVVPLEDAVIKENKLSFEEICQIPRFHNYSPGEPSKVLYLKNLHSKIDVRELISLFGGFSTEMSEPPQYRLLTGRMRGQAFVRFHDVRTAKRAFELINGYKLRGKPIVIEFGKKTLSPDFKK